MNLFFYFKLQLLKVIKKTMNKNIENNTLLKFRC